MRVAVLGLGLIGGSVGLATRERAGAHVTGWDPDPVARGAALEHGAVDAAAPTLAAALENADAAFAASPVDVLGDLVGAALRAAGPDCVVSDVGSVKAPVVAAAGGDPRFVGGHPVAGAEAAGVAHARADLFDGAVWYLTPTARTDGVLFGRLHSLVASFGARPEAIEPGVHDRRMSVVSHLPHVVANLLVELAARELEGGAPAIGGSFRDATRVAGANPRLWAGIYAANRDALADGIEAAIDGLARARDELRAGGDLRPWQEAAAARSPHAARGSHGRRRAARAAHRGDQPARRRRRDRAGARPRGHQHLRHVARAVVGRHPGHRLGVVSPPTRRTARRRWWAISASM